MSGMAEYSKKPGWGGALKEKFYMPILTSRGCPHSCSFCGNRLFLGSRFRARSPENVVAEISFLNKEFRAKEFHIFDAVFNHNLDRAKAICRLIIESGLDISLSFPHGLRADMMDEELLVLLKRAGTYKLVYGIETASPRLQKETQKNLDLDRARRIIKDTSRQGIIVGGYFMLGFSGETEEEMKQTVDFAVRSDLDLAFFFKVIHYEQLLSKYKEILMSRGGASTTMYRFRDFGYYSRNRASGQISAENLNRAIASAQQKFYLRAGRLWILWLKTDNKLSYLRNLIQMFAILLQAYLITILTPEERPRT